MGKTMSELQKGDVIGVTRDDFISNAIENIIDSEVSHIALFIGSGLILEATSSGVIITSLSKYESYKIMRFPDSVDKDKLIEDCKTKLGVKYSFIQLFLGLFLIWLFKLFGKDYNVYQRAFPDLDKDAVVCSELVAWGAMEQGFKFGRKTVASNVLPTDFLKYLEIIV